MGYVDEWKKDCARIAEGNKALREGNKELRVKAVWDAQREVALALRKKFEEGIEKKRAALDGVTTLAALTEAKTNLDAVQKVWDAMLKDVAGADAKDKSATPASSKQENYYKRAKMLLQVVRYIQRIDSVFWTSSNRCITFL
jgi:hypothetical protein